MGVKTLVGRLAPAVGAALVGELPETATVAAHGHCRKAVRLSARS